METGNGLCVRQSLSALICRAIYMTIFLRIKPVKLAMKVNVQP